MTWSLGTESAGLQEQSMRPAGVFLAWQFGKNFFWNANFAKF
jgi:hypothetical protein